jgi:hypothetical protein
MMVRLLWRVVKGQPPVRTVGEALTNTAVLAAVADTPQWS